MSPKRQLADLAVFGGTPNFTEPVHVGRPNIGDREAFFARVTEMLDRCWLTNSGPLLGEFEERVADLAGARHCVATCNGTLALQLVARASGMMGEVILPSFTFVATAHAIKWLGLDPVFCDIDPVTHNIDPARIEELLTSRTTGVVGVHVWGRPCDIDGLAALCDRNQLTLLFDAAHALGCSYKGKTIGQFGAAEVFSFHATKFVNAFEGGAVVTDDVGLAEEIRLISNFGFAGYDTVIRLGINAKMSEVSAAMGLTSLEGMPRVVAANRANFDVYEGELDGCTGVNLVRYSKQELSNYQYVVVEIDEAESGISRDALLDVLHAENILARRYFYPGCHRMEPYASLPSQPELPATEELSNRVLCLPTGTAVDSASITTICEIVRFTMDHAAEVTHGLASARGHS